MPRRVIEHFSQRRAEILERMTQRGEYSARAAQITTLETRRRKEYDVPADRLRAEWRARAAEHGLDHHRLEGVLGWRPARKSRSRHLNGRDRLSDHPLSARGLTRESSTFTRRGIVRAFAEAARDGATIAEIEADVDRSLTRCELVEVEPLAGERRYTTRDLLDLERDLLDSCQQRRAEGTGLADEAARDAAISARRSLSPEQRELVVSLTASGDGVQVVRAAAGTGKTFALDAAREAWQASGVPVLGCALSARAACELRDQAGLDATTIARLRQALSRGSGLTPGAVMIADEAGMVGTRDLAERLDAIELKEVFRQREPWDRHALAALRDGDVERFTREYHEVRNTAAAPPRRPTQE